MPFVPCLWFLSVPSGRQKTVVSGHFGGKKRAFSCQKWALCEPLVRHTDRLAMAFGPFGERAVFRWPPLRGLFLVLVPSRILPFWNPDLPWMLISGCRKRKKRSPEPDFFSPKHSSAILVLCLALAELSSGGAGGIFRGFWGWKMGLAGLLLAFFPASLWGEARRVW